MNSASSFAKLEKKIARRSTNFNVCLLMSCDVHLWFCQCTYVFLFHSNKTILIINFDAYFLFEYFMNYVKKRQYIFLFLMKCFVWLYLWFINLNYKVFNIKLMYLWGLSED
ncbi:hypothetical protein PRUPE_3G236900 [Prunus persica]|uniref:Uncharacterized protein n=1 Tax=Prunus persica TaxID=3760 RepID=A0A251Q4L3_PRUPE|nr:hypothetical protein PRUPE_3G236900 [Prunus persica]